MKFTIRDLLWLTVVVALGTAWASDHWRQARTIEKARKQADRLVAAIRLGEGEIPIRRILSVQS